MQTTERDFLIKASDCNHISQLVFGGAFMAEIDLTCANACTKVLGDSKTAHQSVTHKMNFNFVAPSWQGDVIQIRAKAWPSGPKSISVIFKAVRVKTGNSNYNSDSQDIVAEGDAVFISIAEDFSKNSKLKYALHGLPLEDHGTKHQL